jgi:hypothetical protein
MDTTRKYTHQLNKEVTSISGWYKLHKEGILDHGGRRFLYAVGDAVIDSSCCGTGGCRYAVVPGSLVSWKSGTNDNGLSTSIVKPVTDKTIKRELSKLLSKKEEVTQVQFW